MSSDLLIALVISVIPCAIALVWSRMTLHVGLASWLHKSVLYGAPLFAVLIVLIRFLTTNCIHQADFGFTTCQMLLPVYFANVLMTASVFALLLLGGYVLALFGVGIATELQRWLRARR